MTLLLTPALLLLPQGNEIKTDYPAERTLKIVAETVTELETTNFSFERDGEPLGDRFGGGGGGSSTERVVEYTDTVLESEDGRATKVSRAFDDVEMTGSMGEGERARDFDRESPLVGETLILSADGEDVAAELDGGEPENPDVLKGHHLGLPLDGLLPEGEVEAGDTWEPEKDALLQALLMDIEGSLFPRPSFEDGGERGGREGGGRGGRSGRGGGSSTGFMMMAEWDIEAELLEATEDIDGIECVVIELECSADGDLPERNFGRGGRDRFLSPVATESLRTQDNTYEVELEGKLYFSLEEKRPVKMELEGEFTLETGFEREREGSVMSMERTQEGEIEYTITIEEAGE